MSSNDSTSTPVDRGDNPDADTIQRMVVDDWSEVKVIMTGTTETIEGDGLTQTLDSLQPGENAVCEVVVGGENVLRLTDTTSASVSSKPSESAESSKAPETPKSPEPKQGQKLDSLPDVVLESTRIGECTDCGSRFEYSVDMDIGPFDPCPFCGSDKWEKWGYRHEGEDIPADEIREREESNANAK